MKDFISRVSQDSLYYSISSPICAPVAERRLTSLNTRLVEILSNIHQPEYALDLAAWRRVSLFHNLVKSGKQLNGSRLKSGRARQNQVRLRLMDAYDISPGLFMIISIAGDETTIAATNRNKVSQRLQVLRPVSFPERLLGICKRLQGSRDVSVSELHNLWMMHAPGEYREPADFDLFNQNLVKYYIFQESSVERLHLNGPVIGSQIVQGIQTSVKYAAESQNSSAITNCVQTKVPTEPYNDAEVTIKIGQAQALMLREML